MTVVTGDESGRMIQTPASFKQDSQLKNLFGKFLLTLLSSWLVGPLGVVFLHFWGWGNSPTLISLLLALSAGAPVQLLLNEFVAPGAAARKFFANRLQIMIILVATFAAIWATLISSKEISDEAASAAVYPLLAMFASISIWLSYLVSLRYYNAVKSNAAGNRAAVYVGLTPGLITLAVFAVGAFFQNANILMAAAILPAIAQMLILEKVAPVDELSAEGTGDEKAALCHRVLFAMALLLIGIGIGGTLLRDSIADWRPSYAAIILVSLNLLGTIVISLSRATYLSSGRSFGRTAGIISLGLTIAAILSFGIHKMVSALAALFALQFLLVMVLAIGRDRADPSRSTIAGQAG